MSNQKIEGKTLTDGPHRITALHPAWEDVKKNKDVENKDVKKDKDKKE